MLDSVVALQLCRARAVASFERGRADAGVDLFGSGAGINARLRRDAPGWNSVLSARRRVTADNLRYTLPTNRDVVASGTQMISVFDEAGLSQDARDLISGEANPTYRFGFVPLQMKLIDGGSVLLEGPVADGERTVLAVRTPEVLAAARTYWLAVLSASSRSEPSTERPRHFTERQLRVLALMATDTHDEGIATALGLSVRTVRSEVARILDAVGARTRYAAGLRIGASGL